MVTYIYIYICLFTYLYTILTHNWRVVVPLANGQSTLMKGPTRQTIRRPHLIELCWSNKPQRSKFRPPIPLCLCKHYACDSFHSTIEASSSLRLPQARWLTVWSAISTSVHLGQLDLSHSESGWSQLGDLRILPCETATAVVSRRCWQPVAVVLLLAPSINSNGRPLCLHLSSCILSTGGTICATSCV